MAQYFSIGHIAGSFGLQGEVVLVHNLGKKTSLKGLSVIFVEEGKERFLPYFVTESRIKNEQEVYLALEGITTKEAARRLNTRKVWLQEADFHKYAGKSAPISLIGFSLWNGKEELGIIEEVIEQPMQVLCRLQIQGKEVLIPLHEATIRQIRPAKKQVVVELPDGLLEVYLG